MLLLGATLSTVFAISACGGLGNSTGGGSSNSDASSGGASSGVLDNIDEETVVGGDTAATTESKITITGATDIYLSVNAKNIEDWALKVTATQGDETHLVEVDTSKIKFGEKGTYQATYSYQTESVTVNVTVYDAPTIAIDGAASVELKYSEVYQKLIQGIVAKDCYDMPLDVQVYSYGGAKNADGSFNQGQFTIKFAAIDNAGQIVFVERSVNIVADKAPVLETDYSYDVEDEKFILDLDAEDYNAFLTLSIAGKAVPSDSLKKESGKIYVDGAYIYSVCEKEQAYDMRVMTSYGYSDSSFTMTDSGIVAYDDSDIVAFARTHYKCFESFALPEITLTNSMQEATPTYELFFGDDEIALEDGAFNVDTEGEYTFKVTLRVGQVCEYSIKTYYDLGFENGACYDETTDLTAVLLKDYTLQKYVITCPALKTTVLKFAAGDDATAFNAKLAALNKKYVYELKATATNADGREMTQTTQFTVADSSKTQTALSDRASVENGDFAPKKGQYTSLQYTFETVGGRTGAYRWYSNEPTAASTKTLLGFGDKFKDQLTAGRYVTFDIYVQKAINVCAFFPGNEKRLWLDMKYYDPNSDVYKILDTDTDEIKAEKEKAYQTYLAYYAGVRFFDDKGVQITTGGGFNSGAFNGKWITVEVELPMPKLGNETLDIPNDNSSDYCGISVYNERYEGVYDGGDDSKATYILNVKVSDVKYMDDTTVNDSAPIEDGSQSGGSGGNDSGSEDGGSADFTEDDAIIKDLWA